MTDVIDMLWVTTTPVSSMGKNTIRLNQSKYDHILPGSIIRLHLVETPESKPFMTEELKVRGTVKGNGDLVVHAFGWNNHAFAHKHDDIDGKDINDLIDKLQGFYGSLNQEFIVIFFS